MLKAPRNTRALEPQNLMLEVVWMSRQMTEGQHEVLILENGSAAVKALSLTPGPAGGTRPRPGAWIKRNRRRYPGRSKCPIYGVC